jgi:hypothetical protein
MSRWRTLPSVESGTSTSRPGNGSPACSAANLGDDEEITISVFPPHPGPTAAVRQQAAARLDRILDKAAQNMEAVSDQEFEAAVEEALQQVRQWKT